MQIDKVAARHFYKDDGDKIKQNWGLYEYANNLYSKIEEAPKLAAYRKKHSKEEIESFCVYFTKRLKRSIARANEGKASGIEFDWRYVYEHYPSHPYTQTQGLLEAAMSAWDEQLKSCANCPNQCLTEGYERTDMFDNLEKTGWPTI